MLDRAGPLSLRERVGVRVGPAGRTSAQAGPPSPNPLPEGEGFFGVL